MIHAGLVEIVDAGLLVDLPDAFEALGGTALDLGSTAEAARLLGAAAGLRGRLEVPGPYPSQAASDLVRLVDLLGEEFAARFAEGEHLDAEAAVAYARRAHGERKRPLFGWEAFTPTELQVARLAALGPIPRSARACSSPAAPSRPTSNTSTPRSACATAPSSLPQQPAASLTGTKRDDEGTQVSGRPDRTRRGVRRRRGGAVR